MNRRKFLRNSIITVGGLSLLGGYYSWQVEPFWLELTRHKMRMKNLPPELRGKTVMQISDIHVGSRFDYRFIIESLEQVRHLRPDFVLYTGDYVTAHKDGVQFDKLSEVLGHIVKGTVATLGILGNHDYGKNWRQPEIADRITTMMEAAGVTMLRNQHKATGGLQFLGFDDYWGPNFDPATAMGGFDPTLPSITLCHNPDVCDLDVWGDFEGWILSGHTHGGQVKPPFLPPPLLPVNNRKYTSGLFELDDRRTLYINRALGHLWQVRFNCRPEISVFELEA